MTWRIGFGWVGFRTYSEKLKKKLNVKNYSYRRYIFLLVAFFYNFSELTLKPTI